MSTAKDWTTFGQDVKAATGREPTCAVGRLLVHLAESDPEGHTAVAEALSRRELSHTGIVAALKSRGHELTVWTLARHRKGSCACFRGE